MSNQMPIIPAAAAGLAGAPGDNDDQDKLPVNDDHLDDGETNDSQETVEKDVRESADVSEKAEK